MKSIIAAAVASALAGASQALAEATEISANGSRPSIQGPAETFTGRVTVDPLYSPNEHTHNSGGLATFTPGAPCAWHKKREIKPEDVIWTPPGVKHWHGATTTTGVSHIAITNVKDGQNVEWLEYVEDKVYLDRPPAKAVAHAN